MCHTCPSVADFELCEPVKKNYPILKTLVSRLTSIRSQAGNLSNFQHDENMWKADDDGDIDDVVLITWIFLFKTGEELFGQSKLASVFG